MHFLLLAIAILLPCWYGYYRSVSRGMVEINHVTTFTFGFLFYWITPLAVRIGASKVSFPLAPEWLAFFRERLITPYALSCIFLYCCFMLGDSLASSRFLPGKAERRTHVPRLVLSMVVLFGCGLMIYSVIALRSDLFRPATPTDLRVGAARGAVTACIILFACVALIHTIDRPRPTWKKLLSAWYFLPLIAGSTLMIFLGSRLYVASILVMFAIYQTSFRSKFKLKVVLVAVLLFAFLFGVVGTWREGSSASGAFFNVFLEPMEGSLSLVHHLRYKGIAWINWPSELISDFQNLVPTVLMPEKYKSLRKPDAFRPLGGLHSFVSFNLNFGLIGTAVFWLLWPMLFRYCRSRASSTLFATIYVMCSGWLTFTFFRDPFSISLVKAMFEDSILIPLVIIGFGRLLSAACLPVDARSAPLPPQPEVA